MKQKLVGLRMAFMEAFYWAAVAAGMSYMTAMFLAEGIRAALIGLVAVAATGGAFLGQFVLGNLSDRLRTTKWVFVIGMAASVPFCFLACKLSPFWLRLLCIAMTGFFQTPCAALIDTWVLLGVNDPDKQYGFVRASGSMGYAVFCVIYGICLSRMGYIIIPWFTLGLTAILIALAVTVPDAVPAKKYERSPGDSILGDISRIFRKKQLPFIYVCLFFTGLGVGSTWNILPMLLEKVGGDVSIQGTILFLATTAEACLVILSKPLGRISDVKLLALGGVMGMLLNIGIGISGSVGLLIVSCCFRGFSYGFTLLGMRRVLLRLAPADLSSTVQTLGDAANSCLGSMIGGLTCGMLLDFMGTGAMAMCCVGSQVLAIAALIPVFVLERKSGKAA